MSTVSLLKYQALGNDFLVALEPAGLAPDGVLGKETVRALCDRHLGVGADGLILVHPPSSAEAVAAMELRNADGGRAETSGNGLRCLVLALVDAGRAEDGEVVIETDGGEVRALVGPELQPGAADVRVSMGRARVRRAAERPLEGFSAWQVEVGNPHLVLIGASLSGLDIKAIGPGLEAAVPGGQNVEAVARVGDDLLELAVWERGVGLTTACGSGSVAAAAAARAEGLVGGTVSVDNPGGRLVVELSGGSDEPDAVLSGPARRVARIEVEIGPGGIG